MADDGFPLGFIGVGIQKAIHQILHHINSDLCCKKELGSLKGLVISFRATIVTIHQYYLEFNIQKGIPTSHSD